MITGQILLVRADTPGTGFVEHILENDSASLLTCANVAAMRVFLAIPAAAVARAFSFPARSLNTAFQIDAARDCLVTYTVDISASLSLTGGATGTVTLQYADDVGMTTNLVAVQSAVNGNTGTLTIGLALTQTATASLTGVIPAGKYVRIATANTVGTPAFTYRTAQEVKL